MSEWIPVSQPPTMTEHGGLLLSEDALVTDGKRITVGWLLHDVDDPACPRPWWSWRDDDAELGDVTHWMPLPPLP